MNPRKLEGILWLADLQDDFRLVDYKKFHSENQVILYLERKKREGICSECRSLCPRIHSTNTVQIRDLSAFGYKVFLVAERFVLRCDVCKRAIVEDHWLQRKGRDFTWRFEAHISRMCEEMTNMAVSRLEDVDDKTVFRIDYELLKYRLFTQQLPEHGPHYSMDEVYFRYFPNWHKDKEKSFVTNLLCLKHRKILTNAPGRGEKAAENCLALLSLSEKRKVESVATDLHDPFHLAIRKHCPNADIVLDRFHIMQLFTESLNDFRKEQLSLTTDLTEMQLLKGSSKWLLLTREDRLSKKDRQLLTELKKLNDRIVDALLVRAKLVEFFDSPNMRIAKVRWYNLKRVVKEADIKQINHFFQKLNYWLPLLWNYFTHKTSSAVIEAINHKIKTVKSAAYGYRNLHYFQLKILQRVGFLNSRFAPLPACNPSFAN